MAEHPETQKTEKTLQFKDKREESFFKKWCKRPENEGKPQEELQQQFLSRRQSIKDKFKEKEHVPLEFGIDGIFRASATSEEVFMQGREYFKNVLDVSK